MIVATIILAGGKGLRLTPPNSKKSNSKMAKQFLEIGGKSILSHSIEPFLNNKKVEYIQIVKNRSHSINLLKIKKNKKILKPVNGGKTRADSVFAGLKSLKKIDPDAVLIHDSARPCVSQKIINNVINKLKNNKAVIPIVNISDAIKFFKNGRILGSLDRNKICKAQTPQGFDYRLIYNLHKKRKSGNYDDDSALVNDNMIAVKTVPGERQNIKITKQDDFLFVKKILLNRRKVFFGHGYDVHKFKKGNSIVLCGIKIPFNKSLDGYSDADVALHSLCDALLGAAGLGDIGEHFSPSNKKYKNINSIYLLKETYSYLEETRNEINNIDITIVAEKPKLGKYKKLMRKKISSTLNLNYKQVNIKATTTEGLGFIGEGKGIASHAFVTLTKNYENE